MRLLRLGSLAPLLVVLAAPATAAGQGELPEIVEPLTPRPALTCIDGCTPDHRGRVALTISCPADASLDCRGKVWIAKGRRAQFAVEPGETASVKVGLDRGLRKRLAAKGTIKTRAHAWAYGGLDPLELSERVTLRARRGE